MRNLYNEIKDLPVGTYVIHPDSIVNYAAKWAYGYVVGIRELELTDLKDYTLFGVWDDPMGVRHWDLVRHVDALPDAIKLARDMDQYSIYDLRNEKEVVV